MVNHEAVRAAERDFDANQLYQDEVQVTVETEVGVSSDDPFRTPTSVNTTVYTVPGTFEFGLFENYKYSPGGIITKGDAYFLTDIKWQETFQMDRVYVEKDDVRYKVTSITKGNSADSIIATLGKK